MRAITLPIICAALAGCMSLKQASLPALTLTPCAAEKPTLKSVVHLDGHFILTDAEMGQLTGYIAALEEGCVAQD